MISRYKKSLNFLATLAFSIPCLVQAEVSVPVETLYVSPQGSDTAEGTRESPLATLAQALERKLETGGRIVLLEGVYTEAVIVQEVEEKDTTLPVLRIEAEEEGTVVFNGGNPVNEWQSWQGKPGVYLVTVDSAEPGGLGIWEERQRVRYREQADEAGVEAYPGSYVILGKDRVLVHTREGDNPDEAEVWISQGPEIAVVVNRKNTELHGIHFRHYLGVRMSGAIRVNADHVNISNMRIVNSTTGILVRPEVFGTTIENCSIQDVGTGIYNLGNGSQIRNCLIEAGNGAFAIEVQQHMRNGIRWYYPARGGTVEDCVTRGFWAGLYVKTISSELERGASPVLIQNNTFLDGIRAASGAGGVQIQPLNSYLNNIVGPNGDQIDMEKLMPDLKAIAEGNYFYDQQDPFVDPDAGNLKIREDVRGGEEWSRGASRKEVRWRSEYTNNVRADAQVPALEFLKAPIYVASDHGVRVSVYLNRKASVVLKYRRTGTQGWTSVSVNNRSLSEWSSGIVVPRWDDQELPYRAAVALLGGELKVGVNYEFQVECRAGRERVLSDIHKLRISGGSKEIHVQAVTDVDYAEGSREHPFVNLQEALDRALPGDTVIIGKGVFTQPAILDQGGTVREPVIIQGAGESLSILDGSKLYPVMLEFQGARNVIVRDLQIRWFGKYGIFAENSEAITVERCRFRNATVARRMSPNGMGIRLEDTPGCRVTECIFTANEYGVDAIRSPEIHIVGNTTFLNLYSGVRLISSSRNSVLLRNSFTFTGNDALSIQEPDAQAFVSLQSDFNNFGTVLRDDTAPLRPENEFPAPARYAGTGMLFGKGIIRVQVGTDPEWHRFTRMADWHQFANKDHHSFFADPGFVEPLKGDFRLVSRSANRLKDGTVIGAVQVLVD